jgi:TonB family protein
MAALLRNDNATETNGEMNIQGLGYTHEQRYGLITSLSIHSLIFLLFFALSLHKNSDVKTFYIQFTQMDEQTAVQSPQPGNEIKSPKIHEPAGNEIKENPVIEEPPVKEPELVKEVTIPAPVPEPVREIEKPKVVEPERKVVKEETPVIKETPAKEYQAIIRNAAIQSNDVVKVASAPAPKPQPQAQSLPQPVMRPQPQTVNHKGSAGTPGSLSYSASSGKPAVIETEFGSSGAPIFLDRQMPVYPMMAKKLGKQGRVVLRLHINEKGRLLNIEVVEPAGYGFTESAMEAVKMSTFSPAHEKGVSVASKALLTVRFVLKKI